MNLHSLYFDKIKHFSLDRRMENLPTSETLLSSMIRQLGIAGNSKESNVWPSEDLYFLLFKPSESDRIASVFKSELTSPVSKKASKDLKGGFKYREYVKPIIPSLAAMTHSPRGGASKKGSPWNPGRWLLEEFSLAFDDIDKYREFVLGLSNALVVHDTDDHDLAKYFTNALKNPQLAIDESVVDQCFDKYERKKQFGWSPSSIHIEFVGLVNFIISKKNSFSRYRWILFLDSSLRMFATSVSVWRFRSATLFIDSLEQETDFNFFASDKSLINYGDTRSHIVKGGLKEYIVDYLTIFFLCDATGVDALKLTTDSLFDHLSRLCDQEKIDQAKAKAISTVKNHVSEFSLKRSTLKNSKEFLEYVGVKKEDHSYRTEDYTFHYKKVGRDYKYMFGDTLLILLVNYVGYKLKSTQFTSLDFVSVMRDFGVSINLSEFSYGNLAQDLLKLGVVEELSDSDSGLIFRVV